MKRNPLLCPRHLSATRAFGYALKLDLATEYLPGLATVWEARLTRQERAAVLTAAIAACARQDALTLMDAAAMSMSTGQPLPPFMAIDEDAATWADLSSIQEKRAYLAAIFKRLPAREQQMFAAAVTGRRVA